MKLPEVLFGSAICLFSLLGVFLLSGKKSRSYGFGWLGLFFFLLALNFIDGMLLLNSTLMDIPWLAFWEDPFALLYGPLIYFFTIHLHTRKWNWTLRRFLHIVPFIVSELLVAIFHAKTSSVEIVTILDSIHNLNQNFMMLIGIVPFFIHLLIYLVLARRFLVFQRDELQQYYSSIDLDWAFQVIQMLMIIFTISFLSSIIQYSGLNNIFSILFLSLNVLTVTLTLRLLLKAMSQPLFQSIARPLSGSELSMDDMEEIKEKIVNILSEKKLFSNPELTIKDLAGEINISERTVSQVINKALGKNFYDLVNDYRIREACRIFDTNTDNGLTVLEVLYQVGFNSKSSFNTQFKKKTGLTPSEYKSRQRK